eukprot:6872514-Alexandrium_andersonii.AAC.1
MERAVKEVRASCVHKCVYPLSGAWVCTQADDCVSTCAYASVHTCKLTRTRARSKRHMWTGHP